MECVCVLFEWDCSAEMAGPQVNCLVLVVLLGCCVWWPGVSHSSAADESLLLLVWCAMLSCVCRVCCVQRRQANGSDASGGSAPHWSRNSRQQGWGGEPLANSSSAPNGALVRIDRVRLAAGDSNTVLWCHTWFASTHAVAPACCVAALPAH